MNRDSRTFKSIKNSSVALLFYAITFFLSFVSRRILLKELGADLLGLNTTASSILGFLNISELGIATAIAVTLYKPLQSNNRQEVREIVSLQGWFYRRVAFFIIAGSVILMFFFPAIFKKSDVPIYYAYASYLVLLFSSLLGYFFNYKQIVLSASQQQYVLHYSYSSVNILKVVVQLVVVTICKYKYEFWLIVELLFSILGTIILNFQINKSFPDLQTDIKQGRLLQKQYPSVLQKVKQLIFHKLGTFVLMQSSPLVIYAFASLSVVTLYGNYQVLVNGLSSALNALYSGLNAGVGNLVAEGNRDRNIRVFRELFSSRFLLVSCTSLCLYVFSSPLISLWLGKEFILDNLTVLIIVLLFFIRTFREAVDTFINAYGLFSDLWAPVAEAIINILFSILFGHLWGLPGILGGVLLSQVLIIVVWKPILLFNKGFAYPVSSYFLMYTKHVVLFSLMAIIVVNATSLVPINPASGFFHFIFSALLFALASFLILGVLLYLFEQGMRDFSSRIYSFFLHSSVGR